MHRTLPFFYTLKQIFAAARPPHWPPLPPAPPRPPTILIQPTPKKCKRRPHFRNKIIKQ